MRLRGAGCFVADLARAKRLHDTMQTPGWADAMAMLDEQANEPRDELFDMIARTPDKLTGKTSIRLASRAKALKDYRESLEDEIKILLPNPKRGGGE